MKEFGQRADRVLQRINELAAITEMPGNITRMCGTDAFLLGQRQVKVWMNQAGLQTHTDNIGNVRGRLVSKQAGAQTFVIGSHIDTVVNAGKFDGPLGVLLGLDVVEQLIQQGTDLPFHIELIAFSDEEGVRFHTTYLGSKVVAGSFDTTLLDKKDASGSTLHEVIRYMGGQAEQLAQDVIAPQDWLGYFEIHIEQGPVLYEKNIPVAVVTAIAGQKRVEITFTGQAGHAGTVPMHMRQDALCAAAEFVLEVEQLGLQHKHSIVATVGKLHIPHAASNVIPGAAVCTVDLRSADEETLVAAYQTLQKIGELVAQRRKIGFVWNLIQETKPVACNSQLNALLTQAIKDTGYPVISLVSGAGHDAVPISAVSPVSMLFVRCFEGISHNPLENVELTDIEAIIRVTDTFIQQLIQLYKA